MSSATVFDINGKVRPAPREMRSTDPRWLLTGGLARCSKCDGAVEVASKGGSATLRYGCHGEGHCMKVYISPAEGVEAWVVGQLV